jgi:hypothetical protein
MSVDKEYVFANETLWPMIEGFLLPLLPVPPSTSTRTGGFRNHSTRRHSRFSRPTPRKTWRMY